VDLASDELGQALVGDLDNLDEARVAGGAPAGSHNFWRSLLWLVDGVGEGLLLLMVCADQMCSLSVGCCCCWWWCCCCF